MRSTFSADAGYVLAKDTHESKLEKSGVTGFARVDAASCYLRSEPNEKATFWPGNANTSCASWGKSTAIIM
ncbi:MAG: hypothetical protein R2881_05165 [Eubacteriales bacterium]